MSDKLEVMFSRREDFMRALQERFPGSYPAWPLDLTDKKSQQFCRDLTLRGVEEVFEALQHLKNTKTHRMTEVTDFDKDAFLEEIVDSFNYFLSVVIITGFTPDDLYRAYCEKDNKIHERLRDGY
jgi:hypothetical protein